MAINVHRIDETNERSQCSLCGAEGYHMVGKLAKLEHVKWCPSNMIAVTGIDGTWGWNGIRPSEEEWNHPKSPLWLYLLFRGVKLRTDEKERGFAWTTALEGWQIWRRLFKRRPNIKAWEVGAVNLIDYHMPQTVDKRFHLPGSETHVIAHSHGGNLPYIAAALGLKINVLVTVSTPIRRDVLNLYGAEGRKNIGFHIHYWTKGDDIQAAGEVGDGSVGITRTHPYADLNIPMPANAGHTGLLEDPFYFDKTLTFVEHIHRRHGREDFLELRHAS